MEAEEILCQWGLWIQWMVNFCHQSYTICLWFILILPVWIRIRIRTTDPDPQSCWIQDPDPKHCMCREPICVSSVSLHTASKICQRVATYRRQDLPAWHCIPLTSFSRVSLHPAEKLMYCTVLYPPCPRWRRPYWRSSEPRRPGWGWGGWRGGRGRCRRCTAGSPAGPSPPSSAPWWSHRL